MNKKQVSPIDKSIQSDVSRALSRGSSSLQGSSIVKRMTAVATVTTNGAGATGFVLTSSGVQSLSTEWASFAARYLDYRVLQIKATYEPSIVVNTVNTAVNTTILPVGAIVSDPSGSASLTSVAAAWALEQAKTLTLARRWKQVVRASQEEHMLFNPTSAVIPVANRFQITGFADGGSATQTYGRLYYEWIVELRGAQ